MFIVDANSITNANVNAIAKKTNLQTFVSEVPLNAGGRGQRGRKQNTSNNGK